MTKRTQNTIIGCAAAFALMAQTAPAAVFSFRLDNAGSNLGSPTDDGVSHEQRWAKAETWNLLSGVDDGGNGYPDGSDTFTIDRTPGPVNNSTRLTPSGTTIGSVAGITGTGTGNQDIVFKNEGATTIGDLILLASPNPFTIREERATSLTINGVISGPGSLLIHRDAGFIGTNIVEPDDLITITGASPERSGFGIATTTTTVLVATIRFPSTVTGLQTRLAPLVRQRS